MKRPLITLLTDFGNTDHYVGAMKGVMLGICPEAELVDICHEVTPFAITEGAYTLGEAWHCFPAGTVHLAVVDPGVGSARRPLAVEAGGHYFVAPDNGLLTPILESVTEHRLRELSEARYFRQPVSGTFHGRDIFAPVAAYIASGIPVGEMGAVIRDYIRLDHFLPDWDEEGRLIGRILKVDRFGNLITNFDSALHRDLGHRKFALEVGAQVVTEFVDRYIDGPKDRLFLIHGSSNRIEISLNLGRASDKAEASSGSRVVLQLG